MFTSFPTYSRFRTLELQPTRMFGEDVYALQTALNALGFDAGAADGILGAKTDKAVQAAQTKFKLIVDGKAGGATQRTLALKVGNRLSKTFLVPREAAKGSLELESAFRLGNYSPARAGGDYDAGVAQMNTAFTAPKDAFTVPFAVRALVDNTRRHFDLFAGVAPVQRRWALAQGAWNAPAYACYLAREEGAGQVKANMTAKPGPTALHKFEEYVGRVSKYLPH